MTCEACRSFLYAASSAELASPPDDVLRHLDGCGDCAALLGLREVTAAALAEAATGPPPRGGVVALEDRLRAALDAEAGSVAPPGPARRAARARWFAPGPAWAAAAMLLLALAGWTYLRVNGYVSPAGQMPADMARLIADVGHDAYLYARTTRPLELASSDPEEVERWFDGRIDTPLHLPHRAVPGCDLEGARLWHTVSRLAALVQYRPEDGGEPVTLFVVSADRLADRGGRRVDYAGRVYCIGKAFEHQVVAWQAGGSAYALVGHAGPDELLQLAAAFTP